MTRSSVLVNWLRKLKKLLRLQLKRNLTQNPVEETLVRPIENINNL